MPLSPRHTTQVLPAEKKRKRDNKSNAKRIEKRKTSYHGFRTAPIQSELSFPIAQRQTKMAPQCSQKAKVTAAAKKLSQTTHKRHERNFRFNPRVLCNTILREQVLFTKIFERFSPIFSKLRLCHFHGFHQAIKDRQTHVYPVSHVLDPMLVRLKMTPKLSGALSLHGHITTAHSTMEVRRLLVLCANHEALVGRMEI